VLIVTEYIINIIIVAVVGGIFLIEKAMEALAPRKNLRAGVPYPARGTSPAKRKHQSQRVSLT
jgi:hypothetical protein